jgi:LPS-assembly protein
MNSKSSLLLLLSIALLPVASAEAQTARPPRPTPQGFDMDIQADSLEYREESQQMIATGNVVIQYGNETMRADYVAVDTETKDAAARGNVIMLRDEWEWRGDELDYNFDTKIGDFGTFEGQSGNYYIIAEESERSAAGDYEMKNVTATTCDKDDMEFRMWASRATLTADNKVKARNVVPFLGPIPFFYLPFAWFDLDKDHSNWEVSLGQTGSWGAFVLVGYRKDWNENLQTLTHFDVRSKRGLGVGQDFIWQRSDDSGQGALELYYLNDNEPLEDDYDKEYYGDTVDSDRYRVRLAHDEMLTDRDYFTAEMQYLSDPKVREDFFRKDYRAQALPENRMSLSHRGDNYNASVLLNARLNDFYDNVNRLPELRLEMQRQELEDSGIYYQSENSLAFLERVHPERSENEDYDSSRLDSYHSFYYPRKYFGYLNLIPSAGFRGTYYSDLAPESRSITNTVSMTDTNGVAYTTNQVDTVFSERGSDLRTLFEFGLESSFKAFKILSESGNDFGTGLRHVVEPHANYLFRSDPSVEADELRQFDGIDSIRERNEIIFGARNKLQTKRGGAIADLIDVDIFTNYRLDPRDDQEDFGGLRIDGDSQPTDKLWLDFDGGYDWYESTVTDANLRLNLDTSTDTRLHLNYGFRDDDKNLLAAGLDYYPTPDWGLGLYSRYDIDESEAEESSISLLHRMDCVGWEVGLRSIAGRGEEDDDNELWFQVWLLAFPNMEIKFLDASY